MAGFLTCTRGMVILRDEFPEEKSHARRMVRVLGVWIRQQGMA